MHSDPAPRQPGNTNGTQSDSSVNLTRSPQDHRYAAGGKPADDAHLPHERDQHPDSQAAPEAPNDEIGRQAHRDVARGLVDTDEAKRASSVERNSKAGTRPR